MVTKEDALDIARREIEARGLPFTEPAKVTARPFTYIVWTGADVIGGNIRAVVQRRTGKVLEVAGPTPR
jgi:hypothetical protein